MTYEYKNNNWNSKDFIYEKRVYILKYSDFNIYTLF